MLAREVQITHKDLVGIRESSVRGVDSRRRLRIRVMIQRQELVGESEMKRMNAMMSFRCEKRGAVTGEREGRGGWGKIRVWV